MEQIEEGGDAPEKHSGVPEIFSGGEIFAGDVERGLFGEAMDRENIFGAGERLAAFDVAVASFGAGGRNAQHDQVAGRRGVLQRDAQQPAIGMHISDVRVGRKDGHERIAMCVGQVNRGESNGGGSVATDGFGENVSSGNAREFAANC